MTSVSRKRFWGYCLCLCAFISFLMFAFQNVVTSDLGVVLYFVATTALMMFGWWLAIGK